MLLLRILSNVPRGFVAPVALMLLTALSASVHAASWQAVVTGKYEIVELDLTRISDSRSGLTGWSRIRLERDVNDPGGVYNAIHAQNMYDCEARRFTTLKRAYFNGDRMVREEGVTRQRANNVVPGSIDERLLNEVCRARNTSGAPGGVATVASGTADTAAPAGSGADERPSAMRADMRTMADSGRPRLVPVVDASPKPVAPPEPAQLGDRTRRITLPPIDKAAADQAAAAARGAGLVPMPKAETRPETSFAPGPVLALPDAASAAEKRARELQLATSGPRKIVRKKAMAEPSSPPPKPIVSWAYEGAGAPSNWGKLRPDYATCGIGKRQSPIDIRDSIKVDLEVISFDYRPTQFRIVDNGHTVEVTVGEGLSMTVMGRRYDLTQLHFHRPSEERVNGRVYDMSVHLVHKNDEGGLGVIAVLLEKGAENPVIQTLWNHMPLERGMEVTPEVPIDLYKLLPENRAYWTYMGSLTTPPCTENVLWMVLKTPTQVSQEQVAIFTRMYRNNARPTQASNGRLIKESR